VPSEITILPPDNANTDLTDEDSGDENAVNLHNLPGNYFISYSFAILLFDDVTCVFIVTYSNKSIIDYILGTYIYILFCFFISYLYCIFLLCFRFTTTELKRKLVTTNLLQMMKIISLCHIYLKEDAASQLHTMIWLLLQRC
jgi:hypothetical protein